LVMLGWAKLVLWCEVWCRKWKLCYEFVSLHMEERRFQIFSSPYM
jgi:hypothetical protein